MKLLIPTACLLLFSQFFYAQEWVRQNPFPTLSQMYDIDFDGPYGLAVGADEIIYTTTDGGTTWVKGHGPDSTKTLLTAFVMPGTAGQLMLAGGDDYLLLTENGGKFWKITHNYIPTAYKVQSLPGGVLLALGANFGLKSSDKGRLWFPVNMPGMGVTAGHFTSLKNGWVAYGEPYEQQIYITTNGGMTWSIRDPLKFPLVTSIDMLNDQVGFLSSRDFIYKTIDGGNHWEPLHDIASEGGITDLHVVDEGTLWASLNNGRVYFSTNGVWHEVNPALINTNKTLGIWANIQGHVWMVGKYLSILHSSNYGKDWTDQIPANKETLFEPSFFNEFTGMVGGSDGAILRTTNSGAKWEKISFPRSENFTGLEMVDENVVVAGSTSGKIFLSDNQGSTWTVIGQNLGKITDLKAFNRYEIIVTTEGGKIYKTSDSGGQWNIVYSSSADHFLGIYFFDHQFGWATGWKGKILGTNNGGETWRLLNNDKINQFSDVHFTSATEGWVVSSTLTDTIWHTYDAGQSWLKVVLPVKTNWNAMTFMNHDIGWITGGIDGYGVVLRTNDGGTNWFITHQSPDALTGIYAIPGQETVWAVGFGGNIVKYASCTGLLDITSLNGNLEPCAGDTTNFNVTFNGVDHFDWTFPSDWILLGNSNSSNIQFIAGTIPGEISVRGRDACRDTTMQISVEVTPVFFPDVHISDNKGVLVSNLSSGIFQWLFNGQPIPGATNATFQPSAYGAYQLQVMSPSGCGTTSNVLELTMPHFQNSEWVRQNPFPNLSQMYDIDFDGKYGLAVGADASIFTTTDGGKIWVQGKATDSTKILTTAHVVPGTAGQIMLAGGDNNLIITKDGGKKWNITHDYIPTLFKIQSLPGEILIALGGNFAWKSTDVGLLWFPINFPGMGVTAGHFTSLTHGWVAYGGFNDQKVWVTEDGGESWNLRDSTKYSLITNIEMIDDQKGFMSTVDLIYKTTDGGYHWEQLDDIPSDVGINDLYVVDGNTLWSALDNGFVYFTTDGGGVWHKTDPNVINSNKTLGIWANIEGEVWMVGKYVSVLHSSNYGVDWSDQIPAAKETMFEPNFYNEFVGMVGGSDGTIMRTKNSGGKWEKITFPRSENFFGIKMVDDKVVVAGSSSGKVFLSDDQGDTWSVIGENLGQITDLYAFNRFEIFVTTEGGKITETNDGGIEWNVVYNNSSDNLSAIDFFNHQSGWAGGSNGKILVTGDGGETWNTQYNDERNTFSDVHFVSALEGWVTSSAFTDTIWHTSDGGQSWQTFVLPVKTFWRAVSFMNSNIGWVTGGSNGYGIILRTDDGGTSWYFSHESPDALLGIYAVPGQETAWAVGFGGNIVKYSSCEAPPDITELRGNLEPCLHDTVNFVVEFNGVDLFDWTYPSDWVVIGNTNTSSINFIVGSETGVVTVRGRDACGDSTIVLSSAVVPVVPPEIIISENNGDLVANTASGFFQWLFNGSIIPGATDAIYHPTVSGIYQLHYTTFTSGCEIFSNELEVFVTATGDASADQLLVYPNPAKDILYIKYADGKSIPAGSKITLTNINGRQINTALSGRDHINLYGLPSGVYALQIQIGSEILLKKIMVE